MFHLVSKLAFIQANLYTKLSFLLGTISTNKSGQNAILAHHLIFLSFCNLVCAHKWVCASVCTWVWMYTGYSTGITDNLWHGSLPSLPYLRQALFWFTAASDRLWGTCQSLQPCSNRITRITDTPPPLTSHGFCGSEHRPSLVHAKCLSQWAISLGLRTF